jgi:hypothetical protein
MKEKIVKLIDLKSTITLAMTGAMVTGFFINKISADVFIPFVSMTFTFYFAKKKENE